MKSDSESVRERARSAYERGRLRWAVLRSWPVLLLVLLSAAAGSPPTRVAVVGGALALLSLVLSHRGRRMGQAVVPGLVAGALPMVAGLVVCHLPHGCDGHGCLGFCVPFAAVAALVGGLSLGMRAPRPVPDSAAYLLAGAAVAALTGALGCLMMGGGAMLGVALGVAMGTTPAWVPARR